jgi:hypothetical protein
MNQLATQTIEGNLIENGVSIERKLWNIGQGEHDDAQVIGVFAGTETEGSALVAELEASRRHVDEYDGAVTYKGLEYWFQEATVVRSAADILGSLKPVDRW